MACGLHPNWGRCGDDGLLRSTHTRRSWRSGGGPACESWQSDSHLCEPDRYGLGSALLLLGRSASLWWRAGYSLRWKMDLVEKRGGRCGDSAAVLATLGRHGL